MHKVNPSESLSEVTLAPARRNSECRTILGIVVVNIALSTCNVVRHFSDLTISGYVIAAVLWVAVPLGAVVMIWRGRAAGHWVLVGLFGLRGIVALYFAGSWLPLFAQNPSLAYFFPWRSDAIEAVFYCSATLWLLFCCRREPNTECDGTTLGRFDIDNSGG